MGVLVWLLPPTTASTHQEPQPLGPNRSGTVRVVTPSERRDALTRARVWRRPSTPVPQASLGNDPATPRDLECRFKLTKPSGTTPKFNCIDAMGREIKVKYGLGGEIPAEVASSRLLQALGLGADSVVLVEHLKCFGCPKEPFTILKLVEGTHTGGLFERAIDEQSFETFNWVAVERRFPAVAIEASDGAEGWGFFELDTVSARSGGAPRAHVDALRLLAVFLAHWDNKAQNQRLVCLSEYWLEGTRCPQPFLMLQDVGATLGPRKVDLDDWEHAPIWKDRASCTVTMETLPEGGATFPATQVSESGRRFLSTLLQQLSDAQLTDLFAAARVDRQRGPLDAPSPVSQWVRVFKARRQAITGGPPCPASPGGPARRLS